MGKVFAAWIVERIGTYHFNGNNDFVVFSEIGKNPSGGRPSKEYALTIDGFTLAPSPSRPIFHASQM